MIIFFKQLLNILVPQISTLKSRVEIDETTLDREAVASICLEVLKDDLRGDAATILMKLDADKYRDTIVEYLDDPDPTMRWHICGLLHDFGNKECVPRLVRILSEDPVVGVRIQAAFALGEIGDEACLDVLQRAFESDAGIDDGIGWTVKGAASVAIEEIKERIRLSSR